MKRIIKASSIALALGMCINAQAADFNFSTKVDNDANTLVVFYSQDGNNSQFKTLDKQFDGQLQRVIDIENFTGDYAKVAQLVAPSKSNYSRILVVGTGKADELDKAKAAKLGGNIHARLVKAKAGTASVIFDDVTGANDNAALAANFAHGANLRDHRFENYKKEPNTETVSYTFDVDNTKQTRKL